MNVNKGEIVYCNIEFQYERKNSKKIFNKKINQCIFARPYNCNDYPILDVIKYSMLINKIDKKNVYYIFNVKVLNLKILARTGYIANFNK